MNEYKVFKINWVLRLILIKIILYVFFVIGIYVYLEIIILC